MVLRIRGTPKILRFGSLLVVPYIGTIEFAQAAPHWNVCATATKILIRRRLLTGRIAAELAVEFIVVTIFTVDGISAVAAIIACCC